MKRMRFLLRSTTLNHKISTFLVSLQKKITLKFLKNYNGEIRIRTLSVSEEATMIIDQFLSDTEIASILLSFQKGLSSDENYTNNTTDDSDDSEEVEEGIVLASV